MNDLLKMAVNESASLSSEATSNIYSASNNVEKLYNKCQNDIRSLSTIFNAVHNLPASPERDQVKASLEELRLIKHDDLKIYQDIIRTLKQASDNTSKSGSWAKSIASSS